MPGKKSSAVDNEAIARKAYELWEARGYPHGDPEHDWYEAERHLRAGESTNGKKAPKRKAAAKKPTAKKADKRQK